MPLSGPPLANEGFVPLHRVLQKGLEARPDDIAFASALTRKTWRQLENESDNYARHLLSLGLKPGDRVATLMPNRCALLIHYLGCFKARLVAETATCLLPLGQPHVGERIQKICDSRHC